MKTKTRLVDGTKTGGPYRPDLYSTPAEELDPSEKPLSVFELDTDDGYLLLRVIWRRDKFYLVVIPFIGLRGRKSPGWTLCRLGTRPPGDYQWKKDRPKVSLCYRFRVSLDEFRSEWNEWRSW